MIPDHANPKYVPAPVEHPDQFSCRGCDFKFSGEFARAFAKEPWFCRFCNTYNTGTRIMRGTISTHRSRAP